MYKIYNLSFIFLMAGLFISCQPKKDAPLFEHLSSRTTGINFVNQITSSDTLNIYDYIYFYNGGGVALGDVNNNGLLDIFFTGNMVSSRLYLNKGDFKFEDITKSAGIETTQWATGVTMVDINGNGHLDIYVSCAGGPDPQTRKNLLFVNNGDNTFTEQAEDYGIADTSHTTQAAFFDYNRNGYLDLYLLNHAHEIHDLNTPKQIKTDGSHPSTDKLYRNNGDGTFTDISHEAGILYEGYGLGLAISDINRNGWPDVYVSNDFIGNDVMYINNGDGTFSNQISDYLDHQSWSAMGNEIADYTNNGYVDIFVPDMLPESNDRQKMMFGNLNYGQYQSISYLGYDLQYVRNTLQLNNGNGTFSEIGQLAGVDMTDWSWSSLMADFDNDGYKDLFISNGYLKDMTFLDFITHRQRLMMFMDEDQAKKTLLEELERIDGIKVVNKFFKNTGDLTFEDRTESWGFSIPSFSNGAAYGDLNNDGDLDLVISNINDEAFIYRNMAMERSHDAHFLNISLKGNASNPDGIGTKVWLHSKGNLQFIEKYQSRGFQSSVSGVLHFGLDSASIVDSLEIVWPDGRYQKIKNIAANKTLEVDYTDTFPPSSSTENESETHPLFHEQTGSFGIAFQHLENEFNDFDGNPLLPQMYSKGGPAIAVGDINGSGLDDIFISGAAGHHATFFIQQQDGEFKKEKFPLDPEFEDMGALLFDANNDGNLDLYVVSGGSEFVRPDYYQDRLYLNDGNGNFTRNHDALPRMISSGSTVIAADYNRNGQLDLFVGGRIEPGNYPFPPRSYLLENNEGVFKDLTEEKAEDLLRPGMVTSALWTDFDNDGWMDLMVVGEWMPISVFRNEQGTFREVTESVGLGRSNGWWNSLISGDFNNDGNTDYIVGNLGLNTPYKASPTEPVEGYANDFSRNGTTDFVMTRFVQGESYPVFPRDLMLERMPFLHYQFPNYSKYAHAQIEDVFAKNMLRDAYKVESTVMQTSIIRNNGAEGFQIEPLPVQAQFSPVHGMESQDFNGDGNLDLLIVGNNFHANPITGRYDASAGLYLKGDGKGEFQPMPVIESGFHTDGDTRSLAIVNRSDRPLVLVSENQGPLKTFQVDTLVVRPSGSANILHLQKDDAYAIITFAKGYTQKTEFVYGSGYLSQSSRILYVPDSAISVEIFDYRGNRRKKLYND